MLALHIQTKRINLLKSLHLFLYNGFKTIIRGGVFLLSFIAMSSFLNEKRLEALTDFTKTLILEKLLPIFGLIILFFILKRLLTRFMYYQLNENKNHRFQFMSFQRKQTIVKLINNGLNYLMFFFLAYSILSILGVPIATLVASAGIAGLAVGFGAKDFVADLVNGFFIVVENQFDVGDSVIIEDIEATIKETGLRTTILQGFDGTVHYVPNSEIRIVSNLSQYDRRIFVDLPIYDETNLESLEKIVQQVTESLKENYQDSFGNDPIIRGLVMQPDGQFSFRIIWYVDRDDFLDLQSAFYAAYFKAMHQAGIPFARPLSYIKA